jgi:hypothetical protein
MSEQEIIAPVTPAAPAPAAPAAPAPAAPAAPVNLIDPVTPADPSLTNVPTHPVVPKEEYDLDPRLSTADGKLNKEGAKAFLAEVKAEREKNEKRILDLRRKVSDGHAPEDKKEYFQDYAPKEDRYMKFFDPAAPSANEINQIKDSLADVYHDAGLSRRQADDMTHVMLKVLENTGVIDARTKEEKYIDQQKWVEDQKHLLGSNADNIIREARLFVENAPIFSAKTKNSLLDMMNKLGAPFIDTLHQLKDAYGSGTGGVPGGNVGSLGGLASDVELKQEYMKEGTSDLRKQEIIAQRAKAGRTGRLMDAHV